MMKLGRLWDPTFDSYVSEFWLTKYLLFGELDGLEVADSGLMFRRWRIVLANANEVFFFLLHIKRLHESAHLWHPWDALRLCGLIGWLALLVGDLSLLELLDSCLGGLGLLVLNLLNVNEGDIIVLVILLLLGLFGLNKAVNITYCFLSSFLALVSFV